MTIPPISIGSVIAVLVLILAVVLGVTEEISQWLAILSGLLAVARLT
jgi:hypothetical protein